MHVRAVYANYAINSADLLLAFGVRFDDHVTGKLTRIRQAGVRLPATRPGRSFGKNKNRSATIFSNIRPASKTLNKLISQEKPYRTFRPWRAEIEVAIAQGSSPFRLNKSAASSPRRRRSRSLCKMTEGKAIISTGVGQHQMWAAQHYKFDEPRNWLTSGGCRWFWLRPPPPPPGRRVRMSSSSTSTATVGLRHERSRARYVARGEFARQVLRFEVPIPRAWLSSGTRRFYKANSGHHLPRIAGR